MIELGKYGIYVIAAYGVTMVIMLCLGLQTLIDFVKTKNRLTKIIQKKTICGSLRNGICQYQTDN